MQYHGSSDSDYHLLLSSSSHETDVLLASPMRVSIPMRPAFACPSQPTTSRRMRKVTVVLSRRFTSHRQYHLDISLPVRRRDDLATHAEIALTDLSRDRQLLGINYRTLPSGNFHSIPEKLLLASNPILAIVQRVAPLACRWHIIYPLIPTQYQTDLAYGFDSSCLPTGSQSRPNVALPGKSLP